MENFHRDGGCGESAPLCYSLISRHDVTSVAFDITAALIVVLDRDG
ncbi:hypothetical protein [Deinococcus humi]|uniref:Uncharacterized protein (DUF779 family) n=1 Tax=Deinococcus humi TaxID=662880 RepID=A0A7W8NG62_9DEIO|nr:hypothetical protein [Deinococcus humi]MBB5366194.1 uncharacterized protein (DUF779 family) [Deinococcus humi]